MEKNQTSKLDYYLDRLPLVYKSILIPGWGQTSENKKEKGILILFGFGLILSFVEKFQNDLIDTNNYLRTLALTSYVYPKGEVLPLYYYQYKILEKQRDSAETGLNFSENFAILFYSINILDVLLNEKDIEKRFFIKSSFNREKNFEGGVNDSYQVKFQISF